MQSLIFFCVFHKKACASAYDVTMSNYFITITFKNLQEMLIITEEIINTIEYPDIGIKEKH